MGPGRIAFLKSIGQRDHLGAALRPPDRPKAKRCRKTNLVKLHVSCSPLELTIAIGTAQRAVHLGGDLVLGSGKSLHIRGGDVHHDRRG
jgi:hypothetical protein